MVGSLIAVARNRRYRMPHSYGQVSKFCKDSHVSASVPFFGDSSSCSGSRAPIAGTTMFGLRTAPGEGRRNAKKCSRGGDSRAHLRRPSAANREILSATRLHARRLFQPLFSIPGSNGLRPPASARPIRRGAQL